MSVPKCCQIAEAMPDRDLSCRIVIEIIVAAILRQHQFSCAANTKDDIGLVAGKQLAIKYIILVTGAVQKVTVIDARATVYSEMHSTGTNTFGYP